jgi:hypothetical protein
MFSPEMIDFYSFKLYKHIFLSVYHLAFQLELELLDIKKIILSQIYVVNLKLKYPMVNIHQAGY